MKKTERTYTLSTYTVRFEDAPGAPLQCFEVNATSCPDGTTCHIPYFEIEQGTAVIGSLRDALNDQDLIFHVNISILGKNYATQTYGKLTAFADKDSYLVQDLVGSAASYMQSNKTCT